MHAIPLNALAFLSFADGQHRVGCWGRRPFSTLAALRQAGIVAAMSTWRSRQLPPFATGWGPRTWLLIAAYGLRAAFELVLARIRLRSVTGRTVVQLNAAAEQSPGGTDLANARRIVANIAWIIPRIAARLPWRADCLVQALAARRWLLNHGIGTEIVIGVDRDQAEGLLAHAWLRHGNQTVTGGNISRYAVLVEAGNR